MRILVNPITCEAHGLCAGLLPEWITLDEWGYPIIRDGPIPPGARGPRAPSRRQLPDARAAFG